MNVSTLEIGQRVMILANSGQVARRVNAFGSRWTVSGKQTTHLPKDPVTVYMVPDNEPSAGQFPFHNSDTCLRVVDGKGQAIVNCPFGAVEGIEVNYAEVDNRPALV